MRDIVRGRGLTGMMDVVRRDGRKISTVKNVGETVGKDIEYVWIRVRDVNFSTFDYY